MTAIQEAAADIGYHDELAVTLEYSWEEPQKNHDTPTTHTVSRHIRSREHAVDSLLFGSRTDAAQQRETVSTAINILQRWYNNEFESAEDTDREKTPVQTSAESRWLDLDSPEDAEITAQRVEPSALAQELNCMEYCATILQKYINNQIENELWQEKQYDVADILEQNDREFLAETVKTYARKPEGFAGQNTFIEHVSREDANSVEEYLDGLEYDGFQPI